MAAAGVAELPELGSPAVSGPSPAPSPVTEAELRGLLNSERFRALPTWKRVFVVAAVVLLSALVITIPIAYYLYQNFLKKKVQPIQNLPELSDLGAQQLISRSIVAGQAEILRTLLDRILNDVGINPDVFLSLIWRSAESAAREGQAAILGNLLHCPEALQSPALPGCLRRFATNCGNHAETLKVILNHPKLVELPQSDRSQLMTGLIFNREASADAIMTTLTSTMAKSLPQKKQASLLMPVITTAFERKDTQTVLRILRSSELKSVLLTYAQEKAPTTYGPLQRQVEAILLHSETSDLAGVLMKELFYDLYRTLRTPQLVA